VDVAIISVPARDVIATIAACGRKGVKGAIVFSSGFAEVGATGRALQGELARVAGQAGVRIIGPNCQGLVALHQRLNLSFSSAFIDPGTPGAVGLVVQSGAVGGMLGTLLRERGVGFSYWISAGNEADLGVPECIEFFARDPETRIIGAYVESIRDGRRLLAAVTAARAAGRRSRRARPPRTPARSPPRTPSPPPFSPGPVPPTRATSRSCSTTSTRSPGRRGRPAGASASSPIPAASA